MPWGIAAGSCLPAAAEVHEGTSEVLVQRCEQRDLRPALHAWGYFAQEEQYMQRTFRDAIPTQLSGMGASADQQSQAVGQMTARTIPLAGIPEMAGRVRTGN
jgi:hypothetical protein